MKFTGLQDITKITEGQYLWIQAHAAIFTFQIHQAIDQTPKKYMKFATFNGIPPMLF